METNLEIGPTNEDGSLQIKMQDDPAAIEERILAGLSDEELVTRICNFQDERLRIEAMLRDLEDRGKREVERRIVARGGTVFTPHPELEKCEIVDEWSAYSYDLPLLDQTSALLPDSERVKIVKHIPEQTVTTPAHLEHGAAVSISALIRKYGEGSIIGQKLSLAMTRAHLGKKLVFKRKALPPAEVK